MQNYHYTLFILITLLLSSGCKIQQNLNGKNDVLEIRNVLMAQESAWNQGHIERFMEGYWNDEKLTFVGKSGINYGWKTTLNNYKKGYPDKDAMGILNFEVFELTPIASEVYYMLGQYTLTRENDQPTGFFSLVWKKLDGKWLIVSDHTSG